MGLFTPSLAFDRVVVKYIGALKIPASILVELVVEELQRTVRELLEKVSWLFFADSISSPSHLCFLRTSRKNVCQPRQIGRSTV